MDFALFDFNGFQYFMRWLHFFFGIVWIGHLYYFNFTQGPFFNETDGTTKSNAIQKLVPRALWWFRWGAMFTFITGAIMLLGLAHQAGWGIFETSRGICILTGASLATVMFLNVWLIIWPKQKIVIQSATQVAQGGTALPHAAAAGALAGLSSRHNTLFSIPMLFFMGAGTHLNVTVGENSPVGLYYGVFLALLLGLEINGIKGKLGPMTTVRGVITCGFILSAVIYVLMEVIL